MYELRWVGPVGYGRARLEPNTLDPKAPTDSEIDSILGTGGLYAVIGDHPIHGAPSLLYIGKTKEFDGRFLKHRNWLSLEWRLEIYFCEVDDSHVSNEAEKLLIYAHSPPYNSQHIDTLSLVRPMRISNVGRYWRLLPEISSEHEWYQQTS